MEWRAKAHITNHNTIHGKGDSTDYKINISWSDAAGKKREVENLSVSDDVWKRLASGDRLVTSEIPIKYLESDQEPRAILVWDADETLRLDLLVIYVGAGFTVLGIAILCDGAKVFSRFRERLSRGVGQMDALRPLPRFP